MPNLDSPVLTLGALFVAGNSSQGRNLTGGESGVGLLSGGFAAASSDAAVNEIRSSLGIDASSLSDELAQALLGAGVSWAGRTFDGVPTRITNPMARGIHYDVASQAFEEAGFTLGEFLNNGTSNGGTSSISRSGATRASTGSAQAVHNVNRDNGMKVY